MNIKDFQAAYEAAIEKAVLDYDEHAYAPCNEGVSRRDLPLEGLPQAEYEGETFFRLEDGVVALRQGSMLTRILSRRIVPEEEIRQIREKMLTVVLSFNQI